jgi:serine/threonine-protein kinase
MREELGWRDDIDRFSVLLDDRQGPEAEPWFSAGSAVVGVVPKGSERSQWAVAPPGTRFLGGKVYIIPENKKSGDPARVIVKYDRVKVPGKDELPVCFVAETTGLEVKDTAAKSRNWAGGWVLSHWP